MHRLLKFRSLSLQQLHVMSKPYGDNINVQFNRRVCCLCKQNQNFIPVRFQSTNSNPVVQVRPKRKRSRNVRYAEVLEVTGETSTESRASVRKLKAKHLSLLANEPEIGLGELHKIKTRSRFVSTSPADPTLTTTGVDEIEDNAKDVELTIDTNTILEHEEPIEEHLEEIIEEAEDETVLPTGKQRERAGKEEALARVLGSYIEMCVANGNPNRALSTFHFYRKRSRKHPVNVSTNIQMYNTLLQGFAHKHNIIKMKSVLTCIEDDKIEPNENTYVAIFECLGRLLKHSNRSKNLQYYYSMMTNQGYSFDDIMNKADFIGDQREIVLGVFQRICPDYKPTYNPPELNYNCGLLNDLNCDHMNQKNDVFNGAENREKLFSSEELKERMKQQLDIEMNGYVQVRSIESKPKPSAQVLHYRELVKKIMSDWEKIISDAFDREMEALLRQTKHGNKSFSLDPYLQCIPKSDYVKIILNEVRRLAEGSETYSPTTYQLYRDLGSRVYARYQVQRKIHDGVLAKVCEVQEAYCDWYTDNYGAGRSTNTRQKWQMEAHERRSHASVMGGYHHAWTATTQIAIGQFLYKIIMHDLKIDVNVIRNNSSKEKLLPAFYTLFRSQGRVVKEEVKPHPVLARLFRGSEPEVLIFPAYEVPMLCPPKPWISVTSGGYLVAHADVVRLPVQAVQQWKRMVNAPVSQLYPALDSLNQLGSVPWVVNEAILDVILAVFNSVRFQSTNSNPVVQVRPKRKRSRNVRYAEVLEVTGETSTESRASVRKLKAKHLSLLANEPEIGLGELHKIKTRSRFVSTSPADPTLTTTGVDEIEDNAKDVELTIDTNTILEHEEPIEEHLEEIIEEAEDETVLPTGKQRERAGKEEALARVLASYIEMCVANGNPNRALSTFHFYRKRSRKHPVNVSTNIQMYNTLLQGFAHKHNIIKMKSVLTCIADDKIEPNENTYVAIFECLGRLLKHSNRSKNLQYYYSMMTNQGYSFDDIMNKADFIGDQREIVLGVFQRISPDYKPTYNPPELNYNCGLLNDLNCDHMNQKNDVFNGAENREKLFSSEQLKERMKQQLDIEMNGYVQVRSIESKPEPSAQVLHYRELVKKIMSDWEKIISDAFDREMEALLRQTKHGNKSFSLDPYLQCIPKSDYVKIILNEVRRLAEGSETYSPTTYQLYRDLGSRVYARYQVQRKIHDGVLAKVCEVQEAYCDWYTDNYGAGRSTNTRQKWQMEAHERRSHASVMGGYHHAWTATTQIAIGQFLYKIIMHDLKIDVNVIRNNSSKEKLLPAFYTLFRSQGRVVKEEVKPHPVLARLFRGSEPEVLIFPAYEVPMLCPPKPWISVTSGGYLVAHADVVRLPVQAVQQWKRMVNAPVSQLYPALDSLNQLGSVPWVVNEAILDVILAVFNSGGSSRLDVPQPPSACPPAPAITPIMSKAERYQAFRHRMQVRRRKAEMYSLWCDALYRLSLANHFRSKVFWLPHNMDFRGRVYPVPPHLNHLGSDLARSMLVFAERRPLGPDGLDWLKIHCINLTGIKKRESVQDRLQYANEIMHLILDSADKPLTGKMWWAQSDEPWQTLACCMEIANASRSPDPSAFMSRFPVHQDGSCNGLQHYAALGRDAAGAYSVNLVPASKPQDVYSAVAALVEEQRVKDAANGIPVAQALNGFVRRKVIKQTVMTTVYGVTRFGARLQIARQLKDIEEFPKEMVWPASTYLTSKTFESLRTMFTSTREIQDWFTECARLISAVNCQNVEWVTPLGLPVVQPYSRYRKVEIAKKNLSENFTMDMFERPNVMKQKNAFPPNFIHSLDSSHMMLTSLFCEREGITFMSVHDCFWTHPCSVPIMNQVCREQFVALHSQPILEDLSRYLVKKYSFKSRDFKDDGSVVELTRKKLNKVISKLPSKGDFDLKSVLDSVYFFS